MADNDTLIGNKPIALINEKITASKFEKYGIQVSTNNKLIFNENDISRTISIKYEKGNINVEDRAYINVKAFRKQDEFKYIEIGQDALEYEEKISDLDKNNTSIVQFRENGIYRIMYQLCDKNGEILTEDMINFVVRIN